MNARRTPGSIPSPGELDRHAEPDAAQVLATRQLDRLGELERRRVARVLADHRAEQQRRVGHVARERAGLVERRGERDHPVARDGAVGRLEADDPAQRGGLADRAAGVRADRPRREPGRDGGRAAAARSARDARAVPRVQDRPEGRVLVRRAHRELVLVGLAEQRRAGLAQALDRRRRVRRQVALEDARAGLARDALGAEQVLDRRAGPRRAGRRPARLGGAPRRPPGEGVELVVGGALAVGLEQLAAPSSPARRRSAACAAVVRSSSLIPRRGSGPRSRPRATAGACASATSRGSDGRGSSGRSTFSTSTTCDVGSTSSRSSSEIFSMWPRTFDSSHAIRSTSSSVEARRASAATWRTCARSSTAAGFYERGSGARATMPRVTSVVSPVFVGRRGDLRGLRGLVRPGPQGGTGRRDRQRRGGRWQDAAGRRGDRGGARRRAAA